MPAGRAITRVNDIMSSAPKSVQTSTTIEQLLEFFDRHDFNAFPVTNEVNELVGIVTKIDLLRVLRLSEEHEPPEQGNTSGRSVGEIMHPGVISVAGEDPIGVAADLMVETGLRSIPVVFQTSFAGLGSRSKTKSEEHYEFLDAHSHTSESDVAAACAFIAWASRELAGEIKRWTLCRSRFRLVSRHPRLARSFG